MCYSKQLHKLVDFIDVRFDEELPNKNNNIGFINPLDHHHDSKENEVYNEE